MIDYECLLGGMYVVRTKNECRHKHEHIYVSYQIKKRVYRHFRLHHQHQKSCRLLFVDPKVELVCCCFVCLIGCLPQLTIPYLAFDRYTETPKC